jgi:DNA polymerase-1
MKDLYKNILESVEKEHEGNAEKHKNSRVLIIDGLNTFIRCWTSIPTLNDNGDHVGGVTGVLKSIGYAIRQVEPTRVIVAFDGQGGSKNRKKIFGEYKANRSGKQLRVNRAYNEMMNDEEERESMKRQFVWLMDMLDYLPVTTMIYDGIEADDTMAYIATNLLKENEQAVIMSTDKDFLQLVDEKTIVWSPTKKKIYNQNRIKEEFGLDPKNLLLYRVLDGDSSDNIPGVHGCGLKTVLKRYPEVTEDREISVDEFLELTEQKIEETKGKIKIYKDILDAKNQIIMNERLMQLKDVDISGTIKMNILDRFNEQIKPLNKMDFMKVLLKYKVVNNFGDINDWLKRTFGGIITD